MFEEALLSAAGMNVGLRRMLALSLGALAVFAIQLIAVCGPLGLLLLRCPQAHLALQCAGAGCLVYLAQRQLLRSRTAGPAAAAVLGIGEAAAQQFLNPRAWLISVAAATLLLPPQWEQVLADGYAGMI
jgi:threonine/homoserine/homoserine lactone efflux protein